jgi:hypothetical protein
MELIGQTLGIRSLCSCFERGCVCDMWHRSSAACFSGLVFCMPVSNASASVVTLKCRESHHMANAANGVEPSTTVLIAAALLQV